jgi:two-component system nitrate/nitrite response regulator NarL
MPMRLSLKDPGATPSTHPNGPDKRDIARDVSAETADLAAPLVSITTVVILSDVRFLQEALAEILGREAGLAVIGTAATLLEAQTSWSDIDPNMVLLDTTLPDALAAVAVIRELLPKARVVALAMTETEENVIVWGEAGVASYIPRTATLADVIAAIGNTMRGEQACPAHIAAHLLHQLAQPSHRSLGAGPPVLTAREVEIIQLLAKGLSNKDIARRLSISVATTKSHVHNLLTKLELPRRGHAASWLRQNPAALDEPS